MYNNSPSNSKRIAKNTIVLYIRMIVVMFITLYTSRVVLKALGVEDYGLYNVVGGVVTLMSFLRSSLSGATQRFLSFEMGRGNFDDLKKTFSVCLTSHVFIAFVVLLFAETIGLWFLNSQINIPEGREVAANWIYQFSVVSLCVSVISVPYSADIISHEQMRFFAYLGVLEAILKLVFSIAIAYATSDRLILYGFLMMLVPVAVFFLNWSYCHKRHLETHSRFYWDKVLFKKVFSFSGWAIWGEFAIIGSNQGTAILVNIFHSVVANAALGIGHQVNNAIRGLVSNFQTAFRPQLTKSYAAGDYQYVNKLTNYAAKISFYLFFIFSLPILLNINFVLDVWLEDVPQYANVFCAIFIIATACNTISIPLQFNLYSTGRIKDYQIAMSVAYIVELIVLYVWFKMGGSLVIGVAFKAVLNFVVIFIRMTYSHKEVEQFSNWVFVKNVFLPLIMSAIITIGCAIVLFQFVQGPLQTIGVTFVTVAISLITAYYIGLNHTERESVINVITKMVKHKIH